jgi:ketosteroid isomerase-like protein
MPEDQELIARAVEALNRRDSDALAAQMHDEVEWRPALTAGGHLEGAVYRGRDGLVRYFTDLDAEFASTHLTAESIEPVREGRVLFRGRVRAVGRASGVSLDVPVWSVWEVRDGKVLRGTGFMSEAEALEAAGVRQSPLRPAAGPQPAAASEGATGRPR